MTTLEVSKTGRIETPLTIRWGDALVNVTQVTGDHFAFPAGRATVHVQYQRLGGLAGRISWDVDESEVVCRPRALSVYGSFRASARIEGREPVELDATLLSCSTIVVRDRTAILAVLRNRLQGVSKVKIRTGHQVPPALLAGVFVLLLVDPHLYVSSG